MEFRPGPGAVFVRRAELVILLFPAAFLAGVLLAFSRILAVLFGVLIIILFTVCFFFVPASLASRTLRFDGKYVLVSRGIFWRRYDIIPVSSVITLGKSAHFLARRRGLCNVHIGAVRRNIVIPLLSEKDAEASAGRLTQARGA